MKILKIKKRLEKKKGLIDKLARKLLPQVRRNEKERKSGGAKK